MISFIIFYKNSQLYKQNDNILVYANKVYPYDNPSLTFDISRISFCQPKQTIYGPHNWIDSFMGSKPMFTDVVLNFNKNVSNKTICTNTLTKESIKTLQYVIQHNYVMEFTIDRIPSWIRIGTTASDKAQIYSHISFSINTINGTITDINATDSEPVDLIENKEITFTLSVTFHTVNEKRLQRIRNEKITKTSVHLYSLFNTSILSMLLILLVALISNKISTKELVSMKNFEGFEFESLNDRGWKAVRGDVFRPAVKMQLLTILCGSGVQIFVFVLIYSLIMWQTKSSMPFLLTFFIITSPLCGLLSVSSAQAFGIHKWIRISIGSVSIVPIAAICICLPVWLLSILNKTTFGPSIMQIIIFLIAMIIFFMPLSSLGGALAVKRKMFMDNKCEVKLVPRKIPKQPWYLKAPWLGFFPLIVCGIPSTIEFHYILLSLWGPHVFYPFELLAISITLISINACCSTIISVYLLLQSENHHWQWQSFIYPASAGIATFIYSIFYYICNTSMNCIFQACCYFGFAIFISICISLLCGGIGFTSSNIFVHSMYNNIKFD